MSEDLLTKVAEVSGLSKFFALGVVRGVLRSHDITPETLTSAQMQKLLPELEKALLAYLSSGETKAAIERISRLLN